MYTVAKLLAGLSALSFLLAVYTAFMGRFMMIYAEGYSRASTNLALLAIAIVVVFRERAAIQEAPEDAGAREGVAAPR